MTGIAMTGRKKKRSLPEIIGKVYREIARGDPDEFLNFY
jgi:hypothetical protein